jgi:hypothetical protein
MNRTLAIALIAIGVILAILGILQHELIIHVPVNHLAVILLALGLIAIFAGVFGFVMQGRSAAPTA